MKPAPMHDVRERTGSYYRFRLLDRFDHFVAGQVLRCSSDVQAREHAHRLLAHRNILRVEVWYHQRRIYEARRTDLRANGWVVMVDQGRSRRR